MPLMLSQAHYERLMRILANHAAGLEVLAHGSRLDGTAHDTSDLDLVVRAPGNRPVPAAQWAALTEAFRESTLPILVDLRDWARLPESFHQNISRHCIALQAAKPATATQ